MIIAQLWPSVGACYAVAMVRGSPNPRFFGLPARLRSAGKRSGLTRMALAQKAGVSTATALYAETGEQLPTVGTIARLASALEVTAPWLAYGLGDQHSDGPAANTDDMGTRLQAVRAERSVSRAELARLTDLSPRAIAKVEAGGQSGVEVIEALAQALGLSPGWLAFGVGDRELPPSRRGRPRSQPA